MNLAHTKSSGRHRLALLACFCALGGSATAQNDPTEPDRIVEALSTATDEAYQPGAHLFMVASCGAIAVTQAKSANPSRPPEAYRGMLAIYAGSKIVDKVAPQFPSLQSGAVREAFETAAGQTFIANFAAVSQVTTDWDRSQLAAASEKMKCGDVLMEVNDYLQAKFSRKNG